MINPNVTQWEAWLHKWFLPLLLAAILVNCGGLFVTILEPDGALYATIAKTIAQTGNWTHLRVEGRDWLDKPHFPFWMAALSFRIFGISGVAYKLPALLFWAAGGWYTYRFARELYGETVGRLAVLLYVSAAHLVISNNDVRAEPYLTGLIIGSVFHFYRVYREQRTGWNLFAGSLLAGCAVMTKGPFVLITIASGFIVDWIVRKDWRQFRNIHWFFAILLTGIFIIPELYCLYLQFDSHPEKQVFGRTGVSGIRFFFWDSQLGRFFNTGPIRGEGDPLFYFHTLLWAFLPWSLLLYAAMGKEISEGWKRHRLRAERVDVFPAGNLICIGAAITSFLVFSLSRFQLPHYLNILFPFFSILTAAWLVRIRGDRTKKVIGIVQNSISLILVLLLVLLCWFFHFPYWQLLITGIILAAIATSFAGRSLPGVTARSFCVAILVYGFVNFCLYPGMLSYQAGSEAGRWIKHHEGRGSSVTGMGGARPLVYMLEEAPADYSFEFYCPLPVLRIPGDSLGSILNDGPALVFLPSRFADTLVSRGCMAANPDNPGYPSDILQRFPDFHVSQLTGDFLNYRTRPATLDWYFLLRVVK